MASKQNLCTDDIVVLTDRQISDLRQAFDLFDKDGNGHISAAELGIVMKSLGQDPSPDELRDMIQEVDIDGNHVIDFDEFCLMMSKRPDNGDDSDEDDTYRQAFNVFDEDGNGVIDKRELRSVLKNLGEKLTDEQINEMIEEVDTNGDGVINFQEFKEMMTNNMQV